MPRSRSILVRHTNKMVAGTSPNSETYLRVGMTAKTSNGVSNEWIVRSTMTDDNSKDRIYKAVDHFVVRPCSMFGSGISMVYNPPTPPLYMNWDAQLSDLNSHPPTSFTWDDLVDDLASSIEDETQSDVMIMVILYELRKTISMLRNPFNLLKTNWRRVLGELRHKPAAEVARESSLKAASIWLESRYGWKPFYYDCSGLASGLGKLNSSPAYHTARLVLQRYTAYKKVDISSGPGVTYPWGGSDAEWNASLVNPYWMYSYPSDGIQYVRERRISHEAKLRVTCDVLEPLSKCLSKIDQINDMLGVGSWRQWRDTLWEVLPFSFVVDWFIDFNAIWRPLNDHLLLLKKLRNVGYSIKEEKSYTFEGLMASPVQVRNGSVTPWRSLDPIGFTNRVFKTTNVGSTIRYRRYLGFPSSDDLFAGRGINLTRGVDGVMLFLQKLLTSKTTIK